MEYPVKKLLILSEGKEPEFYGDPLEYSSHIGYLKDYILNTYEENDAIQRWKVAGEPNQIAGALSLFKNVIIAMNEVNTDTGTYRGASIIAVPEEMSEELQDMFAKMVPFFTQFNYIIAFKQVIVKDAEGRFVLENDPIELDGKDTIREQINTIIKETSKKGKSK